MKPLLFSLILTASLTVFLAGCASEGHEHPAGTVTTNPSGGQAVDVTSPDSSTGHVTTPSTGSGAAKMLSPLTGY